MSSSDTYDSDTATDERPSSQPTRSKIQANFQIARPPPKSSLRLAPKLLLQIQQLAPKSRPVPVLEIWQPPFRKSKLTRDFVQRPKLRTGDIYATSNENYIINQTSICKQSTKSDLDDTNAQHKDIVAAMCQSSSSSCSDETPSTSASTIHFREARCSWRASLGTVRTDKTCYRFMLRDEEGRSDSRNSRNSRVFFQCEKRDPVKDAEIDEEFILFLIDRTAGKKSRIATMSPGGLEILVRKSSILDSLEICMGLTGPLVPPGDGEAPYALETWLYTQVLTLGVWVAQQEGWYGLSQH